jgi:hypothetical protein
MVYNPASQVFESVTVHDLSAQHRRYVDLAGRFKAGWTFHQFLQGLQKFFVEAEIPRYPSDFQEIHATLKTVADNLTGSDAEKLAGDLDRAARLLAQMTALLSAADARVSPPLLRQFFERVRNYDDQILAQMVRFYLLLANEDGLTGDRLDKVDFLVTKLAEETDPVSGAVLMRERARLREIFNGFWSTFSDLTPDPAWLEERRREIEEFRRELGALPDLDALADSRVIARYRETKQVLGRYLMHPEVLAAAVETNLAIKNKVRANYRVEEERILSESQRILEMEGKVVVDMQLDQELAAFRQKLEEFEHKQRTDNVKLEDISFLRRQVEDLMPRLMRRAPSGEHGIPGSALPFKPQADEEAGPRDESLAAHYREILDGLGGTDMRQPPREVALDSQIYHLRLEAREVVAYRRVFVKPEGDAAVERFLLEAAALRMKMNEEAAQITEILDETAATRSSPVFERARRTTKLADGYVQRFGQMIDESVRGSQFAEAQHLQLLRMRLIRDYSGLWLLVNRPPANP